MDIQKEYSNNNVQNGNLGIVWYDQKMNQMEKKDLPAIVVDVIHKLNNELDSVFPSVTLGINHFAKIKKK